MIYIEPTRNELINILLADSYANWSYDCAEALIEYLEEVYFSDDMHLEFCHVALRCEYHEYASREEFHADYSDMDWDDIEHMIVAEGDNFVLVYQG